MFFIKLEFDKKYDTGCGLSLVVKEIKNLMIFTQDFK